MKKVNALLGITLIVLAGCDYLPTPENKAKQAVASRLIDSDSAKFEMITKGKKDGDYCGLVNAKNRMGGYAGTSPFIYEDQYGIVTVNNETPKDSDFRFYYGSITTSYGEELYKKLYDGCKFSGKFEEVCGITLSESESKFCQYMQGDVHILLEEMRKEFDH